MNFSDWSEVRAYAIGKYNGETPHPITEQEIIEAYELHPAAVEKAVDLVATDLQAGKIRSGWAILRKRAETIRQPPANPSRPASVDREKRIQRAEQWLRNAGIHYDRASEIDDELFNERGLLHAYRSDKTLRARIADLWAELRPQGETLEQEAEKRAQEWKRIQEQLRKEPASATASASENSATSLNHDQAGTASSTAATDSPAKNSSPSSTPSKPPTATPPREAAQTPSRTNSAAPSPASTSTPEPITAGADDIPW